MMITQTKSFHKVRNIIDSIGWLYSHNKCSKKIVIDSRLLEITLVLINVTHHYPHDVVDGSRANYEGASHF